MEAAEVYICGFFYDTVIAASAITLVHPQADWLLRRQSTHIV